MVGKNTLLYLQMGEGGMGEGGRVKVGWEWEGMGMKMDASTSATSCPSLQLGSFCCEVHVTSIHHSEEVGTHAVDHSR